MSGGLRTRARQEGSGRLEPLDAESRRRINLTSFPDFRTDWNGTELARLSLAVTVAWRRALGGSHAPFTARSAGIHLVQAIIRHVVNHAHERE